MSGASNAFIQLPFLLEGVIAAVIGGCLLTGGYGSAVGAFLGGYFARDKRFQA